MKKTIIIALLIIIAAGIGYIVNDRIAQKAEQEQQQIEAQQQLKKHLDAGKKMKESF